MRDLATEIKPVGALEHAVVLAADDDEASGLADMLHQFLEQLLDEDPRKARLAQRISGDMLFRAAEDTSICVRLSFNRERVQVADHDGTPNRWPALTADFLTTAHMTTGEESPFALIARRRMRVRCAPWHAPFLVRVLRLMRIPPRAEVARARRLRMALVLSTAMLAAIAAYWWLSN